MNIPLLSDMTHQMSKDYGVYLEHLGHSLRGLFIIDSKGIVRQITMNDLPVGRSVDETIRLVQAFQYADVVIFNKLNPIHNFNLILFKKNAGSW